MEPISIRKLDNFYGKDRRIINSGLLKGESNYYPEQTQNSFYHLYHKRSVLNYDGNSLFTGFGNSFYNPFFTRRHINTSYQMDSPFYGYLLKSNRDIITLPVMGPIIANGYGDLTEYVNNNWRASEYTNNPNIFRHYVGRDDTMGYSGYFLRSDGHYIMDPIDMANDYSVIYDSDDDAIQLLNENQASILYYIPFFTFSMYGRKIEWDQLFANNNIQNPIENLYVAGSGCYFPQFVNNIIIGPADIFTMGQTYHAILDFEPYLYNYMKWDYPTSQGFPEIYVALRLATKKPKIGYYDFVPRNHIFLNDYSEKCVFLNCFEIYENNDYSRRVQITRKYDPGDNVICLIKADVISYKEQAIRKSLALDIEWRWGLKHTPYHPDEGSYVDIEFNDMLSEGCLNCAEPEKFACPFLEVNIKPLEGEDFTNANHDIDYNSIGEYFK